MNPLRSLSGTISVVAVTSDSVAPRWSVLKPLEFDANYGWKLSEEVAAKNLFERCGNVTTTGKRPRSLEGAAHV